MDFTYKEGNHNFTMNFQPDKQEKLHLLDDHHIQMIHDTSCRLLEDFGVYFETAEALNIASEAGLPVDNEAHIIYFPRSVLENAIDTTPLYLIRKGIDPHYDIEIGNGQLYFGAGSLPLYIMDPKSRSRRKGNYRDMLNFIKIVNQCEYLQIGNAVIKPFDVPDSEIHAVWNQATVKYMRKPACCWYADKYKVAHDTIRILEAAAGGLEKLKYQKTWALTACPMGSLKWGHSAIGLLEMAEVGIPVEIMDTPFPGSLSPVTLAGTIALSNANILAGVTLAQIINPGTPLIYCFYGGIMDMNIASHVFGTPESALYTAAAVQLCHSYQIPSNMTVPAVSAKVPDAQCSFEKMMNALLPALSGVDCLSLFGGIVDFGMSASYEQMIIDNEMVVQIKRIRRGFEVTPQTLAEDVIKSIGHGGYFLETEHTLHHFKEELFFPNLSDRNNYEVWKKQGAKNIVQRAEKRVEEILNEPYPEDQLTPECSRDVDNVVKDILKREKVSPGWITE